jgi:hypothetical protein
MELVTQIVSTNNLLTKGKFRIMERITIFRCAMVTYRYGCRNVANCHSNHMIKLRF